MVRDLTAHTSLFPAPNRGAYPYGNSLLVSGSEMTLLMDPSLVFTDGLHAAPEVDLVLLSHAHEDHIAGLQSFADSSIAIHNADKLGIDSLKGLLTIYGMPPEIEKLWVEEALDSFHYAPRPDAATFEDGHLWDLGGGTTIRAIHMPGHTRGHTGFLVEPDGVLYLGDIDLTGFGPYYGDAWSDLSDWYCTMELCREIDAGLFSTFHHKGVIEGREAFIAQIDRYQSVIVSRERALLDFLVEPHSMSDIVRHRFVYRPEVDLIWVDYVEERSMGQHLELLMADGAVEEVEPGVFRSSR